MVAHLGPSFRAGRFWCLVAALAPDVDGLGLVFGREVYVRFHHILAHNFLFLAAVTALSARWIGRSPVQLALVFLSGVLHLVGDYWGSGPGWPLYPLAPFSWREFLNPAAWAFNGLESQLVLAALFAATVAIARVSGRTPLECVAPSVDRLFSDLVQLGLSGRCACGGRAFYRCHECRRTLCAEHRRELGRGRILCAECEFARTAAGPPG